MANKSILTATICPSSRLVLYLVAALLKMGLDLQAIASSQTNVALAVSTTVNIGSVPPSAKVTLDIPVTNRTDTPIRVVFDSADCGCVNSLVSGIILAGGESGSLSLSLATEGRQGSLSRYVKYRIFGLDNPATVEVNIKATVGDPVVLPVGKKFGPSSPGERKTARFRITTDSGLDFSGIRQIRGPNLARITRPDSELHGTLAPVIIEVVMPNTSSDEIEWAFEADFQRQADGLKITTLTSVTAVIPNGVFTENTLYLGTLRKSAKLSIEREFTLVNGNIALSSLKQPSWETEMGSVVVSPGDKSSRAKVRVEIPAKISSGIHTYTLTPKNNVQRAGEQARESVQIPVRVLILP